MMVTGTYNDTVETIFDENNIFYKKEDKQIYIYFKYKLYKLIYFDTTGYFLPQFEISLTIENEFDSYTLFWKEFTANTNTKNQVRQENIKKLLNCVAS